MDDVDEVGNSNSIKTKLKAPVVSRKDDCSARAEISTGKCLLENSTGNFYLKILVSQELKG